MTQLQLQPLRSKATTQVGVKSEKTSVSSPGKNWDTFSVIIPIPISPSPPPLPPHFLMIAYLCIHQSKPHQWSVLKSPDFETQHRMSYDSLDRVIPASDVIRG